MFILSNQKKEKRRNIVKPVEGDDIQVSIVGATDDVPWRQSSYFFFLNSIVLNLFYFFEAKFMFF